MITTLGATLEVNTQIAAANREQFQQHSVTVVSFVGPTGTGKTSVIEAIAKKLQDSTRIAVIIGNPTAVRNSERLTRLGLPTVAIETDNLTAYDVRQAMAELDLDRTDLILIECTRNTLSEDQLDLGQDLRLAVFSAAGGNDKAHEHAKLILQSDLVLLTKMDLLPLVEFDLEAFAHDLADIHPLLEMLHVSGRDGSGVNALVNWIALRATSGNPLSGYHPSQRLTWFHGGERS